MTQPSILISGYYGFANAGDEAILSVIVSKLREQAPDARITVLSGHPASTAANHGVDAILWSDPLEIANAVRDASLVIVGGGGLFHDYSGFIPDGLFTEGNWGLGFHVTAALMAALFSRPLMLYAVGVGPLFSEHGRNFTRAAVDAAVAISVRDDASAALLQQIGVTQVRVSADPAFCFEGVTAERVREIFEAEGLNPDTRRIAVVVRHWDFGVHPVFWQEQMAAGLDRLLDQSDATGIDEVVFVPFQKLGGQSEDDAAVSGRIHAAMRYSHTGEARVLKGAYSPAELCGILQSSRIVIGMRLHSLIFAAAGRVPLVSISYDPKVAEVMQSAGLEDTVLNLGALTADTLVNRVQEVLRGWSARASRLDSTLERLRAAADCDARTAMELLRAQPPAPALSNEVIELLRTAVSSQLRAYARLKHATDTRINDLTSNLRQQEAQLLLSEERLLASQKRARRVAPLESELHAAKAELTSATIRASGLEEQLRQTTARRTELETQVARLQTDVARLQADVARLQGEKAAGQRQLAEASIRAQKSEQAFRDYRKRLRQWRMEHRNQKAWQVMLVVRKGYTLALQRGWTGRMQFLLWLPGLLVGRTGDLSEYDLRWEDD